MQEIENKKEIEKIKSWYQEDIPQIIFWQWIDELISEIRMEQDCLGMENILAKQDEITKIAKIEENKYWIQEAFNVGALSLPLYAINSRIKELEAL